MGALAETKPASLEEKAEMVLIQGDLSKLEEGEKVKYYMTVCKSLGLNPATKPFQYISLNSKLVLYATKDATEQLRKIHRVSVTDITATEMRDVYVVTAKVRDATGRVDAATGAVNVKGYTGDSLANAIMKAETKAKRRATLSICGLGMLDESELETIKDARTFTQESRDTAIENGQRPDAVSTQKAGVTRANQIKEYLDAGILDEREIKADLDKYKANKVSDLPKDVAEKLISIGQHRDAKLANPIQEDEG